MSSSTSDPTTTSLAASGPTRHPRPKTSSSPSQRSVLASQALDYISKIESHSRTSILDSFYSGSQFVDLAQFLSKHLASRPPKGTSSNLDNFAFLYKLHTKSALSATPLKDPAALIAEDRCSASESPHNSILILSGYPSAEWISHIGSEYRIDPEFWHRHASYLDTERPSQSETKFMLPSECNSIIHLPLVSIASHKIVDGVATPEIVARQRRESALAMADYRYRLRIGLKWKPGDSVVREFEILDEDHFIVEQTATICVTAKDEKKTSWIAVIWLDVGADLAKSPPGPWTGSTASRLDLQKFFHPIVQYRPGIALKTHQCIPPDESDDSGNLASYGLAQSSSLIPRFYGRSLNNTVMTTDPFYAIGELFAFACSSELALLRLVAAKIDKVMKEAGEIDQETTTSPQEDLVFYRRLLERHARDTTMTLSYICNRQALIWPQAMGDSVAQAKSKSAATRLERDFRYILELTEDLRSICDKEVTVMINAANIAEAKRSIEHGKTLFRFTWLASIFVPLSFTTSLFGMNVIELGQGDLHIWVWAMVTIPIFLLSVVFLFWNKTRLTVLLDRIIRLFVL